MQYYLKLKSILVSAYLLLLPYRYTETLFIILILITFNLNRKIFFHKILKSIKNNSFFILFILFSNLLIDNKYSKLSRIADNNIRFPYFFEFISVKNYVKNVKVYSIKFIVPNYIIKIIAINTLHIIITSNLFFIAKNEILLHDCKLILSNNKRNKNNFSLSLLTILISYEIIEKILNKFYDFYVGLRLKNYISLSNSIKYINCFTQNIIHQTIEESYLLIIVIWNRF
uniref:Uncharacterized protein n=1 Tax=Polysiphonia infestans TaxID=2006978 RepID=A0A1Z1ME52_9FLOR|nr:hypothetical protein [Polysiphonia infestans]ARW64347.1 hypothetical protein [Polysiphonia infestans]